MTERGGPHVTKPASKGFGSTLIATVALQLQGELKTDWHAAGVAITGTFPQSTFKMARSNEVTADKIDRADDQSIRPRRVLIVEDEMLIAMGLAKGLSSAGWDVIGPVGNVEDAFKSLANDITPDVAMLDINLRGENSYPIANALQTRGIPFLFCTGYEAPNREERYLHHPLVRKPTSLNKLVLELTSLIDNSVRRSTSALAIQ